jgi:hypothetical protein
MMMPMHETRILGAARLELFQPIKSQISFSDFCVPAGTIEFNAYNGFLTNSFRLFNLSYPQYELGAKVHDGMVFIHRNGFYQHSEQYMGMDRCHVVIQWDADSIACGVMPPSGTADSMDKHMRATETPITIPPAELVRLLRTENLLVNSAYRNADDLFVTVLDCLHLCEVDIRRHGAEKLAWGKGGNPDKPRDEPDISIYVASFLTAHGAIRNFDVTCEPIAGGGNVDFYVVAPTLGAGLAKVAIEAKKAESARLAHGLQVQLPEYMARVATTHGIYVTYWLKSPNYPYPPQASYAQLEIEVLHPIRRGPSVRTIGLNLSLGPTPSRQSA